MDFTQQEIWLQRPRYLAAANTTHYAEREGMSLGGGMFSGGGVGNPPACQWGSRRDRKGTGSQVDEILNKEARADSVSWWFMRNREIQCSCPYCTMGMPAEGIQEWLGMESYSLVACSVLGWHVSGGGGGT